MFFLKCVNFLFSHPCLAILDKRVTLCQLRDQYMMIKTPAKAINPRMISNLSGAIYDVAFRQSVDDAFKGY